MCHRIRRWNQVGFRAKADFAYGLAANTLQRFDPDRTLHAPIQNLLSTRVRDRTAAFGSDNRAWR